MGTLVPVLAAYVLGSVAAELTRPGPAAPRETAAARLEIRRPQRVADDTARAFDDTARSSTAHAIAGGTSVALLALASELLSDRYDAALDGPRGVMWVLLPLALAVGVGIFGVRGRYGSAHPGRRPGEPLPGDHRRGVGGERRTELVPTVWRSTVPESDDFAVESCRTERVISAR